MTGTKHLGIFTGLIIAIGRTQHYHAQMLTEIMRGWANQIPDILDKEKFNLRISQSEQSFSYQRELKMTGSPGRQLSDGHPWSQSLCITIGLKVAHKHCHCSLSLPVLGGLLKQRRFARAW
jgi:hypothetical protein